MWFEGFVIFMLLGISGRIFVMARQLENFHDCFHHFEDRVFNPQEEVHVHEGSNLRVMGLEEFMDEFGFDPRPEDIEEDDQPKLAGDGSNKFYEKKTEANTNSNPFTLKIKPERRKVENWNI